MKKKYSTIRLLKNKRLYDKIQNKQCASQTHPTPGTPRAERAAVAGNSIASGGGCSHVEPGQSFHRCAC